MWRNVSLVFAIIVSCILVVESKTILFIGDSITDGNWGSPQGYPCSSEQRNQWDKNHVLGHGFVEMTAGYFMGEFPDSNYNFINRGISGETLSQIASRWQKDVISYKPEVVSLLCGTNDVHYWLEKKPSGLSDFDFQNYAETLDSLISYTKKILPDSKIVLCTPFVAEVGNVGKSSDFKLRKEAVDSIASITRQVASSHEAENVLIVDFNTLSDSLLHKNPKAEYWIWDGIHPTTAMHYQMAKEWIEQSAEL